MKRFLFIVTACYWLAATATAENAGTESPFAFGSGARELALGGSALATADAATAAFWNPSRLVAADRYSFSGFYAQLYESDVTYQYLGAALPTLDLGTFGIGIFRLGINDIEKRNNANLLLGTFDDSRLGFYLAYGRWFGKYEIGASVSIEHQSLDTYSATSSPGLHLSIGRTFTTGLRRLPKASAFVIGRNLLQPGLTLAEENYALPTALDFGLAVDVVPVAAWDHLARLTCSVHKVEAVSPTIAAGLEYMIQNLLSVRAGVRDGNLSFGTGLSYKGVSFDYALVDRDLGSLHMFTLTSQFGGSVGDRRQKREQHREAEFNNLMSQRLVAQNQRTINQLVVEAQQLADHEDLPGAVERLDRALFMACGSGEDTVTIADMLSDMQDELLMLTAAARQSALLDSARTQYAAGDYLGTRYFAGLVLAEIPGSTEASFLLRNAEQALNESAAREGMIESRLFVVDSLVNYGRIDRALNLIQSLAEFAPDDPAVRLTLKRVRFEHWRDEAGRAFAREDYSGALAAVDTLEQLVPGHTWTKDMRNRIAETRTRAAVPTVVTPKPPVPAKLSPEVLKEVETIYREAQQVFQRGELTGAIDLWERVERIAPDYQSVRDYLVNAYRFVGVELYGRNKLEDAVEVWQKAARLEPGNKEVAGYIRRTQTEILKLKELSYDQ
jgi:tetratricopeptide (TPR) repeat protein